MKTEVILSLFVGITVSIGGAYYYLEVYGGAAQCGCSTIAGPKSKMKQIGTTVAMYFYNKQSQCFPRSPEDIGFDSYVVENSPHKSWEAINQKSQYFFFVYEGKKYSGNSDQPLAVTKKKIRKTDKHLIVWEDGHVSLIKPEEAEELIKKAENSQK